MIFMKLFVKYVTVLSLVFLTACGGSKKEETATVTEKRTKLEKLKKDQLSIADQIKALEADLAVQDPTSANTGSAKLVSVMPLSVQSFAHYIDLQGKVDADNISYVSPRLGPGQVKAIFIKKGDHVRKGQLLLKLDDAIQRQSITAARQSIETIKTQLAFAKDVYNRQNNVWKQGIGTEVQVLTAKTNVETLEKQLRAGEENIKTMQEQANAANIYSDVSGIADEVNVRMGEMFTGFAGAVPQIKIVNTSSLKVVAQVPENYASKVKMGAPVLVILPDGNSTPIKTVISLSGQSIDPNNRSFIAEAKIPYSPQVRPNQIAQIRIQDYAIASTLAVPVNTVQSDENGKYVFIAAKEGDKMVARKKSIGVGELNGQLIEVKVGLKEGDQLITDGYQSLYEGQVISVVK
ncbi:MAG: efflux transporter periplasmic adaptor subunit [Chitinophagaceae bacterium]|nr:efflux transporter periplasmic adaptor subunit [Chitinophagaceae bacterium]